MDFRAWTEIDTEFETGDEFAFHKISFQWYSTIGVFLTWIPAVIVSHLTGGQDLNKFNIRLLSPCIQKLLPVKYRHIKIMTTDTKISILKQNDTTHEPFELMELKNNKNGLKNWNDTKLLML